jgi:hypothetical protein
MSTTTRTKRKVTAKRRPAVGGGNGKSAATVAKKRPVEKGNGQLTATVAPAAVAPVGDIEPIKLTKTEADEFLTKTKELEQLAGMLGNIDLEMAQLEQRRAQVRQVYFERRKTFQERVHGVVASRGHEPKSRDWHLDIDEMLITARPMKAAPQ